MALTPQERWAAKQMALGRCTRCGSKRGRYKRLCDHCQGMQSEYMRRYRVAQSKAKEARMKALGR